MVTATPSKRRLLFLTLSLTYIAVGILGTLPAASLLQLASHTHVSISVAGAMFTLSALGDVSGAVLAGTLTGRVKSHYLLVLGLALLGGGLSGALVAFFPGQLVMVYSASALVGLFYGTREDR